MKIFQVLLITLLLSTILIGQSYKQVKVYLDNPQKDVPELAKFDFDIEHSVLTKNNELIFFVSDEEYSKLAMLNYKIEF